MNVRRNFECRRGPRGSRSKTGSILVILMLSLSFLVIPLLMMGVQIGLYLIDRQRLQNTVEAACLIAANDLSRITINDPNFGFVALSNFPPIGKATKAPDGEPLPVTGINTLVGTLRQNAIVARELQNDTMDSLVIEDRARLDATIRLLNSALKNSLCTCEGGVDIHGQKVEPVKDVVAFLKANLPGNMQLETIKLSTGWLSNGATTNVPVPQPDRLAELKPAQMRGGFYQPFVDVPVGKCAFSFAGVGPSSRLVAPNQFQPADEKHICSIVRIECVVARKDVPIMPLGMPSFSKVQSISCCQPYSMPDLGPRGLMTIRFTGGSIPGLESWRDFLSGNFMDNQITRYDALGGDFPVDGDARLTQSSAQVDSLGRCQTTSHQFAENLYYWLRNGHLTPRLDAILAMIDEPFRFGPADIYAYEFASSGSISRRIIARDPFPIGVTADRQSSTVADTVIQGASPIIVFRNNVKNLSTSSGGKHAGQPLTGYPLNWCEIAEYGGDENMARRLNKGRLGTRLTLVDPSGSAPVDLAINEETYNLFKTCDGKTLYLQPRRSFYSGGLALDIEIGGTRDKSSSTVVAAMRNLSR